ncbi:MULTISPECIES: acyl carrier protein [unclassified Streptomyces]|uniref:acyl carrier protein n=1 Tax=unclassified Streptomyces TaxID=2593676 RepID=UPI000EF7EEFD|nr:MULTISPECIES: acyl carrier protein [unclassified Streptomyces]MYV64541.1 acyl carrier protein [Streptomyces sp. SID2131]MZE55500.1 acyl carrier protein [Streptomyces sp. SID5770]
MSITELTFEELAALVKQSAGVTVAPEDLRNAADVPFSALGVDSLGLLGIVGELENRHGVALPPDAERSKTPADFLGLVNSTLTTGV